MWKIQEKDDILVKYLKRYRYLIKVGSSLAERGNVFQFSIRKKCAQLVQYCKNTLCVLRFFWWNRSGSYLFKYAVLKSNIIGEKKGLGINYTKSKCGQIAKTMWNRLPILQFDHNLTTKYIRTWRSLKKC